MIFVLDGRFFKAREVEEITREEYDVRLANREHPLPFEWCPEQELAPAER